MTKETEEIEKNNESLNSTSELPKFIIKTMIVAVAIFLTIKTVLPDIPKIPATERNKLILLSFIQNPYVLWRLSILEEEKGNLDNASMYIEAAIGLMEMNGASEQALKKYRERLRLIKY